MDFSEGRGYDRALIPAAKAAVKDVLGLKALTEALGAPTPKEEPKPVSIAFYLEKKGYRWYITDTRGELSDAVRAFSRLKR